MDRVNDREKKRVVGKVIFPFTRKDLAMEQRWCLGQQSVQLGTKVSLKRYF